MNSKPSLKLAVNPEAWRKEVCSCANSCDSLSCFAVRYHSHLGCTCYTCDHSKTCVLYKDIKANLQTEPITKKPRILDDLVAIVRQLKAESKQIQTRPHEEIKVKTCKCKLKDQKPCRCSKSKLNMINTDAGKAKPATGRGESKYTFNAAAETNCTHVCKPCISQSSIEKVETKAVEAKVPNQKCQCKSYYACRKTTSDSNNKIVQQVTEQEGTTTKPRCPAAGEPKKCDTSVTASKEVKVYRCDKTSCNKYIKCSKKINKHNLPAKSAIRTATGPITLQCYDTSSDLKAYKSCCIPNKGNISRASNNEFHDKMHHDSKPESIVLEKVRKIISEKIASHHVIATEVDTKNVANKEKHKDNNCCHTKTNNKSEIYKEKAHRKMVCCNGKTSKQGIPSCNVSLATEPSIINIIKKHIADKTQNTSNGSTTKPDNTGSFVNRIVITTSTSQTGDKTEDNVGDEVVYEFVRNKKSKKCIKSQNMWVQNASVPNFQIRDTPENLSTQVFDVPFYNYKDSVKSLTMPKESNLDIFKRLKDIYNACTCKARECIASVVRGNVCNCKPCQCEKCRNLRMGRRPLLDSSESCKCIKSKMVNIGQQRDYIVAPVTDVQHLSCRCSPCACFECVQSYGRSRTPPITHEMATEVRRHLNCNCEACPNELCEEEGADTCNCDRHSILMRKPVQKYSNDYDLHYCTIQRIIRKQKENKNENKSDTLAMFAAVPQAIVQREKSKSNCYKYLGKDLSANALNLSEELTSLKLSRNSSKNCNCKPCDCLTCRKHYLEKHNSSTRNSNGLCEICECINREVANSSGEYNNQPKSEEICNCKPCECFECRKIQAICDSQQVREINDITSHLSTNNNLDYSRYYLPLFNAKNNKTKSLVDVETTEQFSDTSGSESGSKSPSKKHELNKSSESVYKAACRDCPDYLIRFPRLTVETCINDVMNINRKLNLANYLKSSLMNITSTISGNLKSLNPISFKGPELYDEHNILNSRIRLETKLNEHVNADKPIHYQPCDDDTCSDRSIEGDEHHRYNVACGFSGTSLTADQLTHIGKKESSEMKDYDEDSGDNSWRSRYMTNSNTEPLMHNSICNNQELEVSKDNDGVLKECNMKHNKSTKYKKNSLFDPFSESNVNINPCINVNLSTQADKLNVNYNSVRKTLQDAKAFSQELLRIIKKYERANREYDSMSKRFEVLHASLLNNNFVKSIVDTNDHKPTLESIEKLQNDSELVDEAKKILVDNRKDSVASVTYCNINTESKMNGAASDLYTTDADCNVAKHALIEPHVSIKCENKVISPELASNMQDDIRSKVSYSVKESLSTEPYTEVASKIHNEQSSAATSSSEEQRASNTYTDTQIALEKTITQDFGIKANIVNNDKGPVLTKLFALTTNQDTIMGEKIVEKETMVTKAIDGFFMEQECKRTAPTRSQSASILTSSPAEIRTEDQGNEKYIEIISQVNSEISDKPLIEKIILKIGTLDNFSKKPSYDVQLKSKFKGEYYKEFINDKAHLSNTRTIKINSLTHKEVINVSKSKKSNVTNSKLSDLQNKYKMFSERLKKCPRESLHGPTVGLTESQITLSNMKIISRRSEIGKDVARSDENQEIVNKKDIKLNTVFLSSSVDVNDAKYTMNEINLSTNAGFVDESKEILRDINVLKGYHKLSDMTRSPSTSTSNEKSLMAPPDQKFESLPSMTSKWLSDLKTTVTPELATIFATKSRYEPMKISFQAVRKVSDHTVLVKWKVPTVMTDVLGYELLIDGRTAQKILSPSRNMAVVTCLPHRNKMILTIRTITSKTSARGDYPSTSIVYCPHSK